MIQKLKSLSFKLAALSLMLAPAAVPVAVYAQNDPLQQNICGGAENLQLGGAGECTDATPQENVNNLIATVINIFSVVVGIIAVIMILFGGFKYITSGGDSGKTSSAQQSIIYAIVGLIIVALAQIIVRFVLYRATTEGTAIGAGA